MREWSATIEGRVIAKKNSKQVFRNRHTGKPVVTSSAAYKDWHQYAATQLLAKRLRSPIEGPVALFLDFRLKGRLDTDLDNLLSSIADLLQDIGIIASDKQIVRATLAKFAGHLDFSTDIKVIELPPSQ